jgi:predicted transposase/invertase (TIGR01784 family)
MNITKNRMDLAQERYDGRQEGLQEGREASKLEIARKMKEAGRPFSEISEFTNLPMETIVQL